MNQKPWWYISFADETGFLGACQVQADSELGAAARANELGISPGGQYLICGPLPGEVVRAGGMPVNKLLTAAEIENPVDTEGNPL
jgi:hypothetical protein